MKSLEQIRDEQRAKIVNAWMLSGDTGKSSETIVAVALDVEIEDPSRPWDPSDFGRCYRLLEKCPWMKIQLTLVVLKYPEWGPLVREWAAMEKLWLEESPSGSCPKLYDLMKVLIAEGDKIEEAQPNP